MVVQCLRRSGHKLLSLLLLVPAPIAQHRLAKLVFPGRAGLTPLAPVKDEIFQLVQCKLARYVVIQGQQLQQVLAGRPVHWQ